MSQQLPEGLRDSLPRETVAAFDTLADAGIFVRVYYRHETGDFVGVGFEGPGGKFTKPANLDTYAAVQIIEEQYAAGLRQQRQCSEI